MAEVESYLLDDHWGTLETGYSRVDVLSRAQRKADNSDDTRSTVHDGDDQRVSRRYSIYAKMRLIMIEAKS